MLNHDCTDISFAIFIRGLKNRWDELSTTGERFELLQELCSKCESGEDFTYSVNKAHLPITNEQITIHQGEIARDDIKKMIRIVGGLITENNDLVMVDTSALDF